MKFFWEKKMLIGIGLFYYMRLRQLIVEVETAWCEEQYSNMEWILYSENR